MPRATYHDYAKVAPDGFGPSYSSNVHIAAARAQSDLNQFLLGQVEALWDLVEKLQARAVQGIPPSAVDLSNYIHQADATIYGLSEELKQEVASLKSQFSDCLEDFDAHRAEVTTHRVELENRISHAEEVTNLEMVSDLKHQVEDLMQNYVQTANDLQAVNEKLMAQNKALHGINDTLKENLLRAGGRLALINLERMEEANSKVLYYDPHKEPGPDSYKPDDPDPDDVDIPF